MQENLLLSASFPRFFEQNGENINTLMAIWDQNYQKQTSSVFQLNSI